MDGYMNTVVTCYMIPSDLRAIADRMEKVWKAIKAGDDLCADKWCGKDFEVRFVVDQMRMREK